jgi:hypothetical protein
MTRPRPLRSALRRLPPIARRDRRIATLQARLSATSEISARRPSYQARLFAEGRIRAHELEADAHAPSVISRGKFWVYEFVSSHGIAVPEQLGRWDEPEDIAWDDLPERAVIKANRGSTGRGVFPLRRVEPGWQVITHDTVLTQDELVAELRARVDQGRIAGPFGAETFLDDGDDSEPLPCEVKAYAFYGEVPLLQVTRSDEHGNLDRTRYRFVDARGTDLINADTHPALDAAVAVDPVDRLDRIDLTIPTPRRLDEVVDVASRLSVAMRLPFARIDVYPLRDRVVFGEVTPRPGGRQWLGADLDTMLGECWERALARYSHDGRAGMPTEPRHGRHGGGVTDSSASSLG